MAAADTNEESPALDASIRWCRDAAGADGAWVTASDRLPEAGQVSIALPGTLELVEDPGALLEDLRDRFADSGRLVAAVTWAATSPRGSLRAFHPASLLGLLSDRYEVLDLELRDGFIGLRARPEADPGRRERSALHSLRAVQPAIERHLDQAFRVESQLVAVREALAGAEQAVIEADEANRNARRQRNEAREAARAAESTWAAQVASRDAVLDSARRRVEELTAALERERQQCSHLRSRIELLESRWGHRLRRSVGDLARRTPVGARLVGRVDRFGDAGRG